MRIIIFLFLTASFFFFQSCGSDPLLEEQVQLLEEELRIARNNIESLEKMAVQPAPGFIHTVFFWFADGVTEEDKATFMEGLKSLANVPTVRNFYIGPPAGTPRDVVDNSYDMALIIHFDDKEAQDTYQNHPIHLAFVETCSKVWTRVQVYDTLVE